MGSPTEPWGIFSVFEIKQEQQKTPVEKTKPRNTLKQLVCFLGVWEGENVIEGEISVVPEFARNTGLSRGRLSDLLTVTGERAELVVHR